MSKSTRPFAIPKPPSDRLRGNEIHNELLLGFADTECGAYFRSSNLCA